MKIEFKPFSSALYLWEGTASVFYSSNVTPLHSHNTLQLIFDIKGEFLFRTNDTEWKKYKCVIIREGIIHQLNTNKSLQLILYIDDTTMMAKKIKEKYLKDIDFCDPGIKLSLLEENLLHKNLLKPEIASLQVLTELILNRIVNLNDAVFADERITKVLQLIKQTDSAELSINHLAGKVFISPSRLRMLFKKQAGFSLHKYIIRYKILSAVNKIINGSTIREAVYRAGFNDNSHFNKMLIKMFDTTPSQFLKENKGFSTINGVKNPLNLKLILL